MVEHADDISSVGTQVDDTAFRSVHRLVEQHLLNASGGEAFEDFKHSALLRTEINYKRRVLDLADEILTPEKWSSMTKKPGKILQQIRNVFSSRVSANLIEHRYRPPKFLEPDQPASQKSELESKLAAFFDAAQMSRYEFGSAFDSLAQFLREKGLNCKWEAMSYLAFLANRRRYFPLRPQRFDKLLAHYGIDRQIEGKVTWDRYAVVLAVADELRERLMDLGTADTIEIHSYMWVAGSLISSGVEPENPVTVSEPDFAAELARRLRADRSDREHHQVGVHGERHVYYAEKRKLEEARRGDLAAKVRVLAMEDEGLGFDILSFEPDGSEIHIEVKATVRTEDNDQGFFLSENERATGEADTSWRVYRVWSVGSGPTHRDLGNIIRDSSREWSLTPFQHRVKKAESSRDSGA